MTRASIVIPSRGGASRLPRLLDALSHQSHEDWEAIVVIDGDVDGSSDVVARHAHLPVRTITFPTNRGRVTALNAGFEAATGEVFIRADDDFEPASGHVAAHVAAHETHECGAIGLPLNIAPPNVYMRVYGQDADRRSRTDAYALAPEQRWRLWGGNTSTTRETFHRVGGFDTRYKGYGWEDLDFGYRVHELGIPIDLLPDAEVRHHMASINTVTRAERAYLSGQARRLFEQLHGIDDPSERAETSTLWDHLVQATARRLDLPRSQKMALATDVLISAAPKVIGRKLVALNVEASASAGWLNAPPKTDEA